MEHLQIEVREGAGRLWPPHISYKRARRLVTSTEGATKSVWLHGTCTEVDIVLTPAAKIQSLSPQLLFVCFYPVTRDQASLELSTGIAQQPDNLQHRP